MTDVNTIVITKNRLFQPQPHHIESVQNTAPGARVTLLQQSELQGDLLEQAEVVFGWPDPAGLRSAGRLRWLHLPSAGADRFAHRGLFARDDVILSSSKGVFAQPISEHVIALMLAFSRNLHHYARQQARREWKRLFGTRDFSGSTVSVLGLGHIGSAIARRAKAMGTRVLAVKRTPAPKPEFVDELHTEEKIDRVIEEADYLVLALPKTVRTEGILSGERIGRMKRGAFVVNIGRGSAIDQEALVAALRDQRIGGAGLDVTSPEPLSEDSPLWELPDVIITAHGSASSPTNDDRRFETFCRNLEHFRSGRSLEKLVDFEAGY